MMKIHLCYSTYDGIAQYSIFEFGVDRPSYPEVNVCVRGWVISKIKSKERQLSVLDMNVSPIQARRPQSPLYNPPKHPTFLHAK